MRKMIMAGAVLLGGTAWAQSIPIYDVNRSCQETAAFGGSFSHMMFGSCIQQEQEHYDRLKNSWHLIPVEIMKSCDETARFGRVGSYLMLVSCINMELEAASNNQSRGFRY